MALKQDERALLQLVCERGQSYEDLAGLLGISEREVRAKARGALKELGGADPDSEVGLTDYLLGQADPIGRADAVRYLQQDPEALELAETINTKLQAIAPGARLPKLPEPKGRKRRAAAPTATETSRASAAADSEPHKARRAAPDGSGPGQSRMLVGLALGGVILLFGILAIAGVFDGGGDDDAAAASDPAEAQRDITPVELEPQNGSGVGGLAEFGLANDQLFVDLELDGLDPDLGRNKAYVLWMMLSRNAGYPVTLIVPGPNGSIRDRFAIPTPVAVVVGGTAQFVEVSESPADELQQVINAAVEDGAPVVPFAGTSLARGRIPAAESELPTPELDGGAAPEAGGDAGGGGGGDGSSGG